MSDLQSLVVASNAVAATSARNEKVTILADYLTEIEVDEVATAVGLLSGEPRQGRVGIGWSTVAAAVEPVSSAESAALTLREVDAAIDQVAITHGDGSAGERQSILQDVFGRGTLDEQEFLRAVFTGGLRQGALGGVVASAVAKAYGVKVSSIRRAAMLLGDLGEAAELAASEGEQALADVTLVVGRAVQPMLASTAASIEEAIAQTGPASIEWKLDGIRIQVHKFGAVVRVFTRNLNEITDRTPRVVAVTQGLDAETLVLDGEVIGGEPHFFDILHCDGADLMQHPLAERLDVLESVGGRHVIPSVRTTDVSVGEAHLEQALAAGHEGAMVKALDTTYDAGRRGKGWRKVKPVHTLDLVVLGAEWGHGRRSGWLSNLHLGARDEDTGDFVMVGKTFKGLTDALLEWQTAAFLERETHREGITVFIRPELVVEIALDSSHASTRYPGGVALRFARVRTYRDDKTPDEADTLAAVRTLMTDLPAGETW